MRAMPLVVLLSATLAAAPPPAARAQLPDHDASPLPGARVRLELWAPGDPASAYHWTGRLLGSNATSLLLLGSRDDTARIPRVRVRRLQVSAGTSGSTGRGALIGALIGGVVIGVAGAASADCGSGSPSSASGWPDFSHAFCLSPGAGFAGGFLLGAPAGALVGALVGSTMPHERWKAAPLPPAPAPLPPPVGSSGPDRQNQD